MQFDNVFTKRILMSILDSAASIGLVQKDPRDVLSGQMWF